MNSFLPAITELATLLTQIRDQFEANTKALNLANELLGNTRLYKSDAAKYLNVQVCTMYDYRQRGLPYEKVGRIVSYQRKDLDEWRQADRVRKHLTQ